MTVWVLITNDGEKVEVYHKLIDALSEVDRRRDRQGWGWCNFFKEDDHTLLFQEIGIVDKPLTIVVYKREVQ